MELRQRKANRLDGHDYSTPGYYFVTVCTKVRDEDILCAIAPQDPTALSVGAAALGGPCPQIPPPKIILTTAGETVKQYITGIDRTYHGRITVDRYVIMPDHIHLIILFHPYTGGPPRAAAPTVTLSDVMNSLKGLTTKNIGYSVWQRGYYDHIIRNRNELRQIREYIAHNPLKWISAKNAETRPYVKDW